MKYVLVLLAFLSLSVLAFKQQDIVGSEIKAVVPCGKFACALVEKDDKQYVLMGYFNHDETLDVQSIYIIENKQLRLIWNVTWRDV